MRTALVLLAAAALANALPTGASAKKPELLPTGNTIAGPGLVTVEPGSNTLVLRQSATDPLNMCITVVHVGPSGTTVGGFVRDPGMVTNGSDVSTPGDAVTACRAGSHNAFVQCTSGGPACKALWRVDKID